MESEADFKSFKVANLLPKEILHAKIADPVWRAFMRGEFDVAAFQAMKAVEVSVRAAAGLGDNLIGVKLMREAFAPEAGPLTDMNAEGGERVPASRIEDIYLLYGDHLNGRRGGVHAAPGIRARWAMPKKKSRVTKRYVSKPAALSSASKSFSKVMSRLGRR